MFSSQLKYFMPIIYLLINPPTHLLTYLPICLFKCTTYLPTYPPTYYLLTYLCTHLPTHLLKCTTHLLTYAPTYSPTYHLPTYPPLTCIHSTYLSIYLFIYSPTHPPTSYNLPIYIFHNLVVMCQNKHVNKKLNKS
jgi:hypothetical protein